MHARNRAERWGFPSSKKGKFLPVPSTTFSFFFFLSPQSYPNSTGFVEDQVQGEHSPLPLPSDHPHPTTPILPFGSAEEEPPKANTAFGISAASNNNRVGGWGGGGRKEKNKKDKKQHHSSRCCRCCPLLFGPPTCSQPGPSDGTPRGRPDVTAGPQIQR